MVWYRKADDSVYELMRKCMAKYHKDLIEVGAAIDVLEARSEKGIGTLKINGTTALAYIRIIGLKDRTMGRGDAEIVIDGDSMDSWSVDRLEAVIDHELTHLVPKKSKKDNTIKRDDLDRPLFVMRKHDHEFGWFSETVRRYGANAVEFSQAQQLIDSAEWMQQLLPGLNDGGDRVVKSSKRIRKAALG
jgi:hypothetical protein